MTINYLTQKATVPQAFVTKGRQRVKQYNESVYLKNGDQFELELFNPTQTKVLAKISLNGVSLGSGIVLRPGERVHLERYFDEAKKFLFETYEIDGNDSDAKRAIQNNGLVEVEFFQEYKPIIWNSGTITYTNNNPSWTYHNTGIGGVVNPTFTSGNASYNMGSTDRNVKGSAQNISQSLKSAKSLETNDVFLCSCNAINFDAEISMAAPPAAAPVETGRVEKGGNSQQFFDYDNTTFNTYYSWKSTWKILPESQKPLVKEDLSVYCTGCGMKRRKQTHKFCPNCGSAF